MAIGPGHACPMRPGRAPFPTYPQTVLTHHQANLAFSLLYAHCMTLARLCIVLFIARIFTFNYTLIKITPDRNRKKLTTTQPKKSNSTPPSSSS